MKCEDVKFGTGYCTYAIYLPWKCEFNGKENKCVSIDKCLLPEIIKLWELGIKTTGCCCGHGKTKPYIGVKPEFIKQMKDMGYKLRYNSCRPYDEDSFIPKTIFRYRENKNNGEWE